MDDLSLSQSLGGLRIANPDQSDDEAASSPPPPVERPGHALPPQQQPQPQQQHYQHHHHHHLDAAASASVPLSVSSSGYPASHAPSEPRSIESDGLGVSSLGFDPNTYSIHSYGSHAPYSDYSPQHGAEPPAPPPALSHRQSMQLLEQQQQQQQQQHQDLSSRSYYPPGQQRPYYPHSARPISGIYNHPNMSTGSGSGAESSYSRVRADTSQSAASQVSRSHSRAAAAAAMQSAANPSRTPSGRQYNPQLAAAIPSQPNAAYPPRRSSRGNAPAPQDPSVYAGRQPASAQQSQTSITASSTSHPGQSSAASNGAEDWTEKGAAETVQQIVDKNGRQTSRVVKKGVKDFAFGRTLGEGSYSQVLAATDRTTNREYAIKILDKRHIIKEKKVKYVNIEKDTLNRLTDHPGIVRLYYTFQDESSLYFVIDVAPNGELLGVLKKYSSFDEECTRFYGAEILDAIEYMHGRGIIHRDLKPENVLLDEQMHVKITDFGTAKILELKKSADGGSFGNVSVSNDPMDGADTDRAVSFVGTAEYVSPELLTDKNACKASDLWAFGCIIYQLLTGRPPFKAANEYLTFQKIVNLEYQFPEGFPNVAKDLVRKLLVLNPADRLAIDGIKAHPFFEGIQWGKGLWKQKPPRLRSYQPFKRDPAMAAAARAQESAMPPTLARPPAVRTHSSNGPQSSSSSSRPKPRVITELAPPTQLDIDWSPVLTRPNERVLKLGQLTVYSQPAPYSPTARNHAEAIETPSKLSRFFGASTTKKRTRLVMISSAARLILAPSGGDKKEAKTVIDLTDLDVTWKSQLDSKGYTVWCVYTRDRHYTFEDTKANTGDTGSSVRSTEDWLGYLESVKEYVETSGGYAAEDARYQRSNPMSPTGPMDSDPNDPMNPPSRGGVLRRDGNDSDTIGRKRFSKRHSKNGLTAVF